MSRPRLILASESPRRKELLSVLGLPFEIVPAGLDEQSLIDGSRPERLARRLARAKAKAISAVHPDAAVLAADTFVVLNGELLGKPSDAADAIAMLRRLRGREHRVITGVALLPPGRRPMIEHVVTAVKMRAYSDAEIEAYVASGAAADKAGAYAIQDAVFAPVESRQGCYCNVMGLPLWTVRRLLERSGFAIDNESMPPQCAACPLQPAA